MAFLSGCVPLGECGKFRVTPNSVTLIQKIKSFETDETLKKHIEMYPKSLNESDEVMYIFSLLKMHVN